MSWLDPGCDNLEQLFQRNTALAKDFSAFVDGVWSQSHLPAPTLALCENRLRSLLGQDSVNAIPVAVSSAEQACLDFTEIYCQDPAAISDEVAAAVVQHYGDAGLVALVQALGLMNGLWRMAQLFEVEQGYRHGQ